MNSICLMHHTVNISRCQIQSIYEELEQSSDTVGFFLLVQTVQQ